MYQQSHLNTELFPAQINALNAARGKKGWGHLLEQGLGKTLVTLCEFAEYLFSDEVDGWVVICPNSLKMNWAMECTKHGLEVNTYVWPDVPEVSKMVKPFLVAVNYEAVAVGRAERYVEGVLKAYRCGITLDESVKIKNPESEASRSCQRLKKNAKFTRILSGAPMTQGPQDLWTQLQFIGGISNSYLYSAFKSTFCRFGGYMNKQILGIKNEDALGKILKECTFRAKKSEYMDLPKLYSTRFVELTPAQKKHYQELQEDFYTIINGQEVSPDLILTKLLKLQQVSSGFVISDTGVVEDLKGGTNKLKVLLESFEETDQKIIIPAHFSHSIEKLKEALAKYNPQCIKGGMKGDEVEHQKHVFNNDKSCRAIILQTQASKYGHTLLGTEEAGRCATMCFYENTYSLDDRLQIEDRNNRIGQTLPCLYLDYISSPIEKAVVQALQYKKSLLEAVVDGVKRSKLPLDSKT